MRASAVRCCPCGSGARASTASHPDDSHTRANPFGRSWPHRAKTAQEGESTHYSNESGLSQIHSASSQASGAEWLRIAGSPRSEMAARNPKQLESELV